MDFSAGISAGRTIKDEPDRRGAPRYVALIRSAKLVTSQGEFVCVVRDVSATGVTVRAFHDLPIGESLGLELQNGETFELHKVRGDGHEASFTFDQPVDVQRLIHENWQFRKRQLRLNLAIPLTVTTLSGRTEAITENLSQQGARIECDTLYAIDQPLRIEGAGLPEIRAKVRWRRDCRYGLVFDNTFSLRDFALVAAAMQCPALVASGQ